MTKLCFTSVLVMLSFCLVHAQDGYKTYRIPVRELNDVRQFFLKLDKIQDELNRGRVPADSLLASANRALQEFAPEVCVVVSRKLSDADKNSDLIDLRSVKNATSSKFFMLREKKGWVVRTSYYNYVEGYRSYSPHPYVFIFLERGLVKSLYMEEIATLFPFLTWRDRLPGK